MPATKRFVMMVDPVERDEWRVRAAKAGMTTAELVRRAVTVFDPDDEPYRAELARLVPETNAAIERMHARFAHIDATLAFAVDPQRDVEARARVAAAITDADVAAMTALLA